MTGDRLILADPEAARRRAGETFKAWRSKYSPRLPAAAEITHVGATSIPGALTKGDLDIALRVAAGDFQAARRLLDETHVQNRKSVRDETFAAFELEGFFIPVGVQLVVGGSRLDVFDQFKAALMDDPGLLAEYNAMKRRFDGQPMTAYRLCKAAFIKAVLSR